MWRPTGFIRKVPQAGCFRCCQRRNRYWRDDLLIAASLAIALLLCGDAGIKVALVIAGYFVLNVAYCLKLKYYAIVDVFVVAFGFVLRLLCGGVAADIPLSPWIVLMTFLLALSSPSPSVAMIW